MGKCVSRKNLIEENKIYIKNGVLYVNNFNFKKNNLILDMVENNKSIKKVIINDNEINIEMLFK